MTRKISELLPDALDGGGYLLLGISLLLATLMVSIAGFTDNTDLRIIAVILAGTILLMVVLFVGTTVLIERRHREQVTRTLSQIKSPDELLRELDSVRDTKE